VQFLLVGHVIRRTVYYQCLYSRPSKKKQAKYRVFSFKSRTIDVQWKTGLLCVILVYKIKITISRIQY